MNHIDILQELGIARSAIEDFIETVSGKGIRNLLRKRDAITWRMNRVADERLRLAAMDTTDALAKLDAIATKLEDLAATTKSIASAIDLAGKLITIVDDLLPTQSASVVATVSASTADANHHLIGAAAHLQAHAALTASVEAEDEVEQIFTAFCNTHNKELPLTRVPLQDALQNEDDHRRLPNNKNCDVDIILIKT